MFFICLQGVKTCGKAENYEDKSGIDEAKGVPGQRGVTERCDGGLMRKRSAEECEEDGKRGLLDNDGCGLSLCVVSSLVEPGVH